MLLSATNTLHKEEEQANTLTIFDYLASHELNTRKDCQIFSKIL